MIVTDPIGQIGECFSKSYLKRQHTAIFRGQIWLGCGHMGVLSPKGTVLLMRGPHFKSLELNIVGFPGGQKHVHNIISAPTCRFAMFQLIGFS